MKVAVYAIAKNEQHNVPGWADSAAEADHIVLVDTGSTDATDAKGLLRAPEVTVHYISVQPWRFDIARNASLALIPADVDYCIALDLDERLQPGWRAELEKAHRDGVTRPRYRYVWNWNDDGSPGLVYGGDKIHTRYGYRWRHPVHEVLTPDRWDETQGWYGLEIHHHADNTKPRSSYLPLLELAVAEDPLDDRNTHYLARDLLNAGRWAEAEDMFRRHLELPRAVWPPERARSMRYLAEIAILRRGANGLGGYVEAENWLLRAIAEAPGYREPWLGLAKLYLILGRTADQIGAARKGLAITERQLEYLTEAEAWDGTLEALAQPSVEVETQPGD